MAIRKSRKRVAQSELFIFEITTWEPHYTFSVNRDPDKEGDCLEFFELHLDAKCVYPDKLVGRTASVIASSRRGLFTPPSPRRHPDEKPSSLGLLHLPPSRGSFYFGVPHESCSLLMLGLETKSLRFVMLSGPALSRGRSFINDLYFSRTSD
jgi:hypothetical protein